MYPKLMLPLTNEDSALAAELYALAFPRPWSKEEILRLTELDGFFGFICPEGMIMLNQVQEEAEIYTVCVRPENRRQGIGKKLLSVALKHAERNGVSKVFLEVAADNHAALKLYESFGFSQIGIRKNYYNHVTDALVLACSLPLIPKA